MSADDPFAELREILESLVEERITSEQSAALGLNLGGRVIDELF